MYYNYYPPYPTYKYDPYNYYPYDQYNYTPYYQYNYSQPNIVIKPVVRPVYPRPYYYGYKHPLYKQNKPYNQFKQRPPYKGKQKFDKRDEIIPLLY